MGKGRKGAAGKPGGAGEAAKQIMARPGAGAGAPPDAAPRGGNKGNWQKLQEAVGVGEGGM